MDRQLVRELKKAERTEKWIYRWMMILLVLLIIWISWWIVTWGKWEKVICSYNEWCQEVEKFWYKQQWITGCNYVWEELERCISDREYYKLNNYKIDEEWVMNEEKWMPDDWTWWNK
jgi:uncharacterized ion transporter superfamily protein YfcC